MIRLYKIIVHWDNIIDSLKYFNLFFLRLIKELLENVVMGRSVMTLMASGLRVFGLHTEINEPLPANYIKEPLASLKFLSQHSLKLVLHLTVQNTS